MASASLRTDLPPRANEWDEKRELRETSEPADSKVATTDDLKGYGFYPDSDDERS